MIPEPGQIDLSLSNFIILLGVVQGILLSITGFAGKNPPDKIRGFLFLIITCLMTEFFLNRTGYMYRVIALVDFSEPLQYAIPPLIYLGVLSYDKTAVLRRWPLHFIPFLLYFLYFIPFYLAPAQYKYDSYYFVHHLNDFRPGPEYHFYHIWGGFRNFQMQLFYLQTTIYLIFTFQLLIRMRNSDNGLMPGTKYFVRWWFIFSLLIAILVLLVMAVKILFVKDLGDHIIAIVLTFILYLSTIAEMIRPAPSRVDNMVNTTREHGKGNSMPGLDNDRMSAIYTKLTNLMENDHLYRDNLISLQKLAKLTGEPAYVVSRVINEKSGYTFFDWIAYLRVEEARKLLLDPKTGNYTIEQIAEEVGYNSKSAFNKAFKKFTGKTPSEHRTS